MEVNDQVTGAGGGRLELLGRLAGLAAGVSRPAGIRNGGLLLVLVGLAVVMTLVDRPPEPVTGGRGGGMFQYLPPPVGITRLPPATPPGGGQLSALGEGERPAAMGRAHPRRVHPRPVRLGSSGLFRGEVVTAPVGGDQPGSGGGGGSGSGGSGPPVAPSPPVAAVPATQVRVAPVTVRVTPPPVLGQDLPGVGVETPEVRAETPAVEVPRIRLG